jgi:hypothetical protein
MNVRGLRLLQECPRLHHHQDFPLSSETDRRENWTLTSANLPSVIGKLLSANEIDYRNKDCTSSTSMIEIVVVYTKRPDLIDKLRRPSSTPVCM